MIVGGLNVELQWFKSGGDKGMNKLLIFLNKIKILLLEFDITSIKNTYLIQQQTYTKPLLLLNVDKRDY